MSAPFCNVARASSPCVPVLRHFAKRKNNRASEAFLEEASLTRLLRASTHAHGLEAGATMEGWV
jgi:hypothetical protein